MLQLEPPRKLCRWCRKPYEIDPTGLRVSTFHLFTPPFSLHLLPRTSERQWFFPHKTKSVLPLLTFKLQSHSVGAFMVMQLRITFEPCSHWHPDSVLPHFCMFWNWGVQNNAFKSPGTLGFQKDLCHQTSNIARPFFFFLRSWPNCLRALPIYQLCED